MRFLLLLFLLPTASLFAQEEESIHGQYTGQLINLYQIQDTATGLFNPAGQFLPVPVVQDSLEIRTDASVEFKNLRLELRPRLKASLYDLEDVPGWQYEKPDVSWNHASLNWTESDFDIHYGLENFQWGPGEILSPSQPFTRETILDHVGFYEAPGNHQLRINSGWGENFSFVTLFRPSSGLLKKPAEQEAILLKPELRAADGRWFLGLTMTAYKTQKPSWGTYGQVECLDSTYLYIDSSFAPDQHSVLGGARYNFSNGADLRLEYLKQSLAFTAKDWRSMRSKLREAGPESAREIIFQSWSNAGSLASSEMLYTSLRWPDFLQGHSNIHSKILYSISDPSAFWGLALDDSIGDHMQWLIDYYQSFGAKDRDLTRGVSRIISLGVRYAL